MTDRGRLRATWMLVVTFAAGMAWIEAACVYYLRVMVDRVEPYQPDPLPIRGVLGDVELVREGATLLMLAVTGMLAGRTWRARLGYAAIAFGSWDVLYYVFLRVISGWPASLFDWDILFLLPLPWWGPVVAPIAIASLMIVWGTLVTERQDSLPATPFTRALWGVSATGVLLALGVFMTDSIRALPGGLDQVRQVLPTAFNWPVFGTALVLMATPLAHVELLQLRQRSEGRMAPHANAERRCTQREQREDGKRAAGTPGGLVEPAHEIRTHESANAEDRVDQRNPAGGPRTP